MTQCDTLLMVGSGFPYSEFLPEEGQARGVQIDLDPRMLSLRYPMEVNLVGDSAATLRALLPLLDAEERERTWREPHRGRACATGGRRSRSGRAVAADPINPQRVFWELSQRLPDNCILTADSGSRYQLVCARRQAAARDDGLAVRRTRDAWERRCPTRSRPSSPTRTGRWSPSSGDGAMQMNGMAELITVAKYWQRWTDRAWSCWC